MNQIKQSWNHIRLSLRKIHLVDKCLLLLMLLLLAQSAYILFVNKGGSAEAGHIDIIVRTAAASIFGYFLSANFVQRNITAMHEGKQAAPPPGAGEAQSEIPQSAEGPAPAISGAEPDGGNTNETVPPQKDQAPECARLQIITATAIAVFCLLALILVRNLNVNDEAGNPSAVAVLSQYRDFVSGCVGFLIGCPPPKEGKK